MTNTWFALHVRARCEKAVRTLLETKGYETFGLASLPSPYLASGDAVQVDNGPLEGLTGVVVREKGTDRLVISVSLLQRSVSVEIDRDHVRPLAPAHEKFLKIFQWRTGNNESKSQEPVPVSLSLGGRWLI